MLISEETLRFRSALLSLKKQYKSSYKYVNKLIKQKDLIEAMRLHESTMGLKWAIEHIEHWIKKGRDL